MLLVIAYSRAARQALRNRCNAHPETVVRRFGRAVCLAETELGAFLALRLRERYGGDVTGRAHAGAQRIPGGARTGPRRGRRLRDTAAPEHPVHHVRRGDRPPGHGRDGRARVVRVRFGGAREAGRTVDLRGRAESADPDDLLAAIRDPNDDRVRCPQPDPVHVGHLHGGVTVNLRSALAAAARSRGVDAPQDEELGDLPELDTNQASPPDPAAARRRVADTDAVERQYRAVARELAAAETERVAAEQALDRERTAVSRARDDRQAALVAADRRRNLERAARDHLVATVADAFERALRVVPGGIPATPDEYDGPALPAALAVARVARIRAPLVVESASFARPSRVATYLDAPVLLV